MSATPFRELLDSPGVREVCRLEGRLGFMAYHGGSLEHVTDVIADAAAARSGASDGWSRSRISASQTRGMKAR